MTHCIDARAIQDDLTSSPHHLRLQVRRWPRRTDPQISFGTPRPGEAFLDMFQGDAHEVGLRCEMQGLHTTATSKGQMINALAIAFEKPGGITLLDDPVLLSEFEAFSASQLPSGNERFGAPEGQHDDTVMACALAWTELALKRKVKGSAPSPTAFSGLRKQAYGAGHTRPHGESVSRVARTGGGLAILREYEQADPPGRRKTARNGQIRSENIRRAKL